MKWRSQVFEDAMENEINEDEEIDLDLTDKGNSDDEDDV